MIVYICRNLFWVILFGVSGGCLGGGILLEEGGGWFMKIGDMVFCLGLRWVCSKKLSWWN